jgi:hypothetical protein
MLSQAQSPNIARWNKHGKANDNSIYWIIMERLNGLSLDHLFGEDNPLPEIEVIKVCTVDLWEQSIVVEYIFLLC